MESRDNKRNRSFFHRARIWRTVDDVERYCLQAVDRSPEYTCIGNQTDHAHVPNTDRSAHTRLWEFLRTAHVRHVVSASLNGAPGDLKNVLMAIFYDHLQFAEMIDDAWQ